MADEIAHIEQSGDLRTATIVSKNENGQIDLSITTSIQGSNTSSYERVGVTADGHVYVNNVIATRHPERDAILNNGMTLMSMPEEHGVIGNTINPKLAELVRKAYAGFTKDGVLDAREAGKVHEVIEKALQQTPTQRIDTKGRDF